MITEFLKTVYLLARNSRWEELSLYFSLIKEIISIPHMEVTPQTPIEKDIP